MHFSLLGVIKSSIVYRGQAPGAMKIQYMFTPTEDESGKGVDIAVTLLQGLLFLKLHNKYSKRLRALVSCRLCSCK